MRNLFLIAALVNFVNCIDAQNTFFNAGAGVYVNEGTLIHVNGNMIESQSTGLLLNNGIVQTRNSVYNGDFEIRDSSVVKGAGIFRIQGDWVNSAWFIANSIDSSHVYLDGHSQLITGDSITSFYNLTLDSSQTVKTQTVNSITSNSLNLQDNELATDTNVMLVTNSSVSAVLNNQSYGQEGFVSSLGNGNLTRVTEAGAPYLFPTGSSTDGFDKYRPVELTPASSNTNVYSVGLMDTLSTLDGYDITQIDSSICRTNPEYYHRINRNSGLDSASISVFYDPNLEPQYDGLAQWNVPQSNLWNSIFGATKVLAGNYNNVTVSSWNDFSNDPFLLTNQRQLQPEVEGLDSICGEVENIVYTASGNGNNYQWTIEEGTIISGQGTNEVEVSWEYGAGIITVISEHPNDPTCNSNPSEDYLVSYSDPEKILLEMNIPSVFTPNNDSWNDQYYVEDIWVDNFRLELYNRWGQLMFEASTPQTKWDGFDNNGVAAPEGVYFFVASGECDNRKGVRKGTLTLLR